MKQKIACFIAGHDFCNQVSPKILKIIYDAYSVGLEQAYCKRCKKVKNIYGLLSRHT
ncbi:MAG TPA: hypothetical protein VNU45_12720 [Rummeliibacillus sp.]|nr:hypothetical protein [Rummeliibacillus sp.]